MADFYEFTDNFPTKEDRGEETLVIYEKEETDDAFALTQTVKPDILYDIFGDIIESYDDVDNVEADALLERSRPDPDGDTEYEKNDLKYDHVINDWQERGIVQ